MNNNKKKNNIVIYIKFAVIMVIAALVGFGIGTYGMKAIKSGNQLGIVDKPAFYKNLYIPGMIIFMILTFATIIVSNIIIHKAKKRMLEVEKLDDEEYEKEIENVQGLFNVPLIIVNVSEYLGYLFFAVIGVSFVTMARSHYEVSVNPLFASLVVFGIGMINYMYVNNKCIREIQHITPNIKGNVFDFRYQKDMLKSLDEGQLIETAMQSLNSSSVGSRVCLILLVIAILGAFVFDTGIFPVVCLTIVLISMYIAGNVKNNK